MGQLPAADTGKNLSDFIDAGQVAPWSTDAITVLIKAGIISGSDGKILPQSLTTRADMAQVLYNILNK